MKSDIRDQILALVSDRDVPFPAAGSGVPQEAIVDAERQLPCKLPSSYRWWLSTFGGGQIGGDVVLGIDHENFGIPDVVKVNAADEAEGLSVPGELLVAIGNEERFYLWYAQGTQADEYQVVLREGSGADPVVYAASFGEFLIRRIEELY